MFIPAPYLTAFGQADLHCFLIRKFLCALSICSVILSIIFQQELKQYNQSSRPNYGYKQKSLPVARAGE
jgi:hypothetical protein